jgi:predicted transcriptional regulator
MLSRAAPLARRFARPVGFRAFSAPEVEVSTAADAAALSGYSEIDYLINEDATVLDAVQKFAAYNIGCLVSTDAAGMYSSRITYN